eukprot:CAMPEP_0184870212 /NCGR_PEP_ID=MMETSP0580-20130426/36860_1 /TAXON_ID=1118495 /ORGANISM="Dactyliosolen fragilissimus" /LENGTH=522 /DNA_ID=CAMNT_0027372191 /DNA_START=262 /DNA_END=1830 /DNA_ORIENTATION=-
MHQLQNNLSLFNFILNENAEAVNNFITTKSSEVNEQDNYLWLDVLRYATEHCHNLEGRDFGIITGTASFKILKILLNHPPAIHSILLPDKDDSCNILHLCCREVMHEDIIVALARACPASIARQNSDGDTPLHYALRYGFSDALLRSLIEIAFFSSAAIGEDENAFSKGENIHGDFPIHAAISNYVSPEIIKLLLEAHPESIFYTNSLNQTPLHLSCELVNVDVIKVILECSGSAYSLNQLLCLHDQDGLVPIKVLWNNYVETSSKSDTDVIDILESIATILCKFSSQKVYNDRLSSKYSKVFAYHLLGVAIQLGESIVPVDFVSYLIGEHKEILKTVDSCGRTPLHIAASMNGRVILHDKSNHRLAKDDTYPSEILKLILKIDPSAASVADRNGNLPLDLATKFGLPWEGGLRDIFMANPEANHLRNKDNLSCFMVAASSQLTDANATSMLDNIYQLLRCSPHQIIPFIHDTKTKEKRKLCQKGQQHSLHLNQRTREQETQVVIPKSKRQKVEDISKMLEE